MMEYDVIGDLLSFPDCWSMLGSDESNGRSFTFDNATV